jgi:glycosyltransferase involved in cell wall biosynthesis
MSEPARLTPGRDLAVTLVIPAHNEAARIDATLEVVRQTEGIAGVFVVDDGSTDATAEVARKAAERDPRLSVLSLPANLGKAAAMVAGVRAASTAIIAFIDADLIGLRPAHLDDLVRPVVDGKCAMSIGLFRGGRLQTDLSHRLTPFLSGQRCLRWDLFAATPYLENARAGIEVALSLHAWRRGLCIQRVPWKGVTHVMKTEKMGRWRGLAIHLRMYGEILRYAARAILLPPRPSENSGRSHPAGAPEFN